MKPSFPFNRPTRFSELKPIRSRAEVDAIVAEDKRRAAEMAAQFPPIEPEIFLNGLKQSFKSLYEKLEPEFQKSLSSADVEFDPNVLLEIQNAFSELNPSYPKKYWISTFVNLETYFKNRLGGV